jgi:hypothetical protein
VFTTEVKPIAIPWRPDQISWIKIVKDLVSDIFNEIVQLQIASRIYDHFAYYRIYKSDSKQVHSKIISLVEKILESSNSRNFIFDSEQIIAQWSLGKNTILEILSKDDSFRIGFSFNEPDLMNSYHILYLLTLKRNPDSFGDILTANSYSLFGGPTLKEAKFVKKYIGGKEALGDLLEKLPTGKNAKLYFSSRDQDLISDLEKRVDSEYLNPKYREIV